MVSPWNSGNKSSVSVVRKMETDKLSLRRRCQQQHPWGPAGPPVRWQRSSSPAGPSCLEALSTIVIPGKKKTKPDYWHQFGVQGAPGCKHFLFRFGQQHLRSIFPRSPEMPFVCQAWTVLHVFFFCFLDFVLLLFIHCLFYTPSCCVGAVRTGGGVGGGVFPAEALKLVFQVFRIHPRVSSD